MTGLIQSAWQYVLATATGKGYDDVAVQRQNLAARVHDYTSKFDAKLNTAWDEKRDAEKVAERKGAAQEMTNAYYDIATDFYESAPTHTSA